MPRLDETRPFLPVNIALLTVSDTRYAAQDRSGNTLAVLASSAGHHIAARRIVRDEQDQIVAQLKEWIADPDIDVVSIASYDEAHFAQVRRALDAAEQANPVWRNMPPQDRGKILKRAADLMHQRVEHIARIATLEEGKSIHEARLETHFAAGGLRSLMSEVVANHRLGKANLARS